jgi:peptidoglycan/LPS O-acetylase OafA/YrhL
MKSSSGAHFIALDHIRALAAFMVVVWHFAHATNGYPVPFEYVPALFPFSILDEGHTGVALFMTLSGYLFAKLLDGKSINFTSFLWNRFLRLFPLLLVVVMIIGIQPLMSGENLHAYVLLIASGVIFPTLPNGGWSLTVEFHYYLILPFILSMLRKSNLLPTLLIISALALRLIIYQKNGNVQFFAYNTIVGRIDQFVLGMVVYQFRSYFTKRHFISIPILMGFAFFYWYFDSLGGFYQYQSYSSSGLIWILLPTIEGFAYAVGIAWYDSSFLHATTGFSKFIGNIGQFSYSIYLLHFFVVFDAARFVNEKIMNISNFYLACLWSIVFFLLMVPVGYLSFRFIEAPFLKFRKCYVIA